jgi:Phosphotransferase enzyme family
MPDLQAGNDCADAAKAWKQLRPEQPELERIEVLYDVRKTQVYKLHAMGLSRAGIIAKRSRRHSALVERKIYETVLPQLPVSSLLFHGFAEEPEGLFCWLFLEDAGAEPYVSELKEHRNLAANWLAVMHPLAARIPAVALLPDRGPEYYLAELRTGRDEMQQALSNPLLTAEGAHLLKTMMFQLTLLERHWGEVQEFCEKMPRTLVHGDLVERNVRIRRNQTNDLLVMDWEIAGWGVPAIDLVQLDAGSSSVSPDLATYQSTIQAAWPQLEPHTVRQMAHFGRIFRVITTIAWATKGLRPPWINDGILHLQCYEKRLSALVSAQMHFSPGPVLHGQTGRLD